MLYQWKVFPSEVWEGMPYAWFSGPLFRSRRLRQRHFGIEERIVDDEYGVRRFLVYDVEPDVRERVLDELRPGVAAQWSDPRERIGVR